MLVQDAEKPLYGAEYGTVNHDGPPSFVVPVDISMIEPVRQANFPLNGTAMPGAAQGILDVLFYFGTVKGAIPLVEPVVCTVSVQSGPQSFRGHLPLLVRTNGLFRPR